MKFCSPITPQILDPIASPGDPIFYLHHTWLDKLFWEWQARDLPARLSDISGRTMQVGMPINGSGDSLPFTFPNPSVVSGANSSSGLPIFMPPPWAFPPADAMRPAPGAAPQRPEGDPGNVTTLAHILNMFGIIPNATIADVMDIGGPLLCYEYV